MTFWTENKVASNDALLDSLRFFGEQEYLDFLKEVIKEIEESGLTHGEREFLERMSNRCFEIIKNRQKPFEVDPEIRVLDL